MGQRKRNCPATPSTRTVSEERRRRLEREEEATEDDARGKGEARSAVGGREEAALSCAGSVVGRKGLVLITL